MAMFLLLVTHGIHPSEVRLEWIWLALLTGAFPVLAAFAGDLPRTMVLLLMAPLLIPFLSGICYVREGGREWYVWLLMYAGSWFVICGICGFAFLQAGGGLLLMK